jgi:hypothetical protein
MERYARTICFAVIDDAFSVVYTVTKGLKLSLQKCENCRSPHFGGVLGQSSSK